MTAHVVRAPWVRLIAIVVATALSLVVVSNPASAVTYSGTIVAAYAENSAPRLADGTYVHFEVSAPLKAAWLSVFDEDGKLIRTCSSGTSCVVSSNPAPQESKVYTAYLSVQGATERVVVEEVSVGVTDPGFSVGFTAAYTDNPTPVLSERATIVFELEVPMNQVPSEVHITDQLGNSYGGCGAKTQHPDRCTSSVNPPPGQTMTYTAHLTAQGADGWFDVATASVTVTDPGWSGSLSVAAPTTSFHESGELVSGLFQVTRPLESALLDVYFDGVYHHSCSSSDKCGFSLRLGEGEIRTISAKVYALGVSVEPVATVSTFVTSLSSTDLADELLAGTIDPASLGINDANAALQALQTVPVTLEKCKLFGDVIRSNSKYHSDAEDITLDCNAVGLTATDILATAIAALGLAAAFELVDQVLVPTGGGPVNPPADPLDPPLPQPDPTDPGNPAGGGLLPEPKPGVVYVDMDAESWIRSDVICTVTTTDPVSLEEITITLDGEGLKHIIENHLATEDPAKSRWDEVFRDGIADEDLADFDGKLGPENFKLLSAFLCNEVLTREPSSWGISNDDDERLVRNYSVPGTPIGNLGVEPHAPTNEVGVVLDPDLRVYTAHPGASNQYH